MTAASAEATLRKGQAGSTEEEDSGQAGGETETDRQTEGWGEKRGTGQVTGGGLDGPQEG